MKILGSALAAFVISVAPSVADTSVAPSMGSHVLFHEAKMDENNCHTAKRKRHNFHCHETAAEVIQDEVDVTEAPTKTEVASASE